MSNQKLNYKIKIKLLISIVFCLMIIGFTIWGLINSYVFNHKFDSWYSRYKLLTFDSNVIAAIVCVTYIVFAILFLTSKIKQINNYVLISRLVTTSLLAIVMIVILGAAIAGLFNPEIQDATKHIFLDYNLFFHVINPILSIASFLFLENTDKIKFKHTFFSLIIPIAYSVFYLIMTLTHLSNDVVDHKFDPYAIFEIANRININIYIFILIVFTFLIGLVYLVTWLLWLGNKKISDTKIYKYKS